MTIVAAGPRHALADSWVPAPRVASGLYAYEPPAGLGPWVPPLPAPERGLSRGTMAAVGAFVIALVIATVVLITQNVQGAVTKVDATYLSVVRANSSLTASDADLVTAGHTVCTALDQHPNREGLVGVFAGLTRSSGWTATDAAAVVGGAVGAYCPSHRALIGR